MRSYRPVDFGIRDTRQVQGGQVTAGSRGAGAPVMVGDAGWRGRLLNQLSEQVGRHVINTFNTETERRYLDGQSRALMDESEEEIQGDPLTKDWEVAGFRDAKGKLALADMDVKFREDLPELTKKPADEVKSYLSGRRAKMTPLLYSMTREAKASIMGQMYLRDRAHIKTWQSAHQAYILEQKKAAIATQNSVSLQGMVAARSAYLNGDLSEDAYAATVESTAGSLIGSINMDESLPTNIKNTLTEEAIQYSLENDNPALYEFLRDNTVPNSNGTQYNVLANLPQESQIKLSKAYRGSYDRNKVARNVGYQAEVADLKNQLSLGAYGGTHAELKNYLSRMTVNGTINQEQAIGMLGDYLSMSSKQSQNASIMEAVTSGDTNRLHMLGVTETDAWKVQQEAWSKQGVPLQSQIGMSILAGEKSPSGYKQAGILSNSSIDKVRLASEAQGDERGEVNETDREVFRIYNEGVYQAARENKQVKLTTMLAGLSPDNAAYMADIAERMNQGESLGRAQFNANKAFNENKALSPSKRAGLAQSTRKAVRDQVNSDLTPRNWLESAWGELKSIIPGTDAAVDQGLRAESSMDQFWGDSEATQYIQYNINQDVIQAADRILQEKPYLPTDAAINAAKADTLRRTVRGSNMLYVVPPDADIQKMYGVGPDARDKIGVAMQEMFSTKSPDNKFYVWHNGPNVMAMEFKPDGTSVGTEFVISPIEVRAGIRKADERIRKSNDEVYGAGKVFPIKEGGSIRINGENGVGVSETTMFRFRKNLVQNEGVVSEIKADIGGRKDKQGRPIMTGGVGLSSTNTYFGEYRTGKMSSDEIEEGLKKASNEAMLFALPVAQRYNLNESGTLLVAEINYQGGAGSWNLKDRAPGYHAVLSAIQSGDSKGALQALTKTKVYKDSGDSRKRHYAALVIGALKR